MKLGRVLLALVWVCGSSASLGAIAELVVRNANVITVDTNQQRAQAFAIIQGKFKAVGSNESVEPLIGETTRVLDLSGKSVVPGFV